MLGDSRVDQVVAQCPQALQRTNVIQADETAVAHDIGMHHGH